MKVCKNKRPNLAFIGWVGTTIIFSGSVIFAADNNFIKIKETPQPGIINYSYSNSFEDEEGLKQVKKFTSKGKVKVIKTLSTDIKASGKSSLKVDVTFETSGYYYLKIPLNIPAEGSLWAEAKCYVKPTGKDYRMPPGVGFSFSLPPTKARGVMTFCGNSKQGEWISVKKDLVEAAQQKVSARLAKKTTPGINTSNCGKILDNIVITFLGTKGDHITLYLDDVKIQGTIPAISNYKSEIAKRKIASLKQMQSNIAKWQKTLDKISNNIKESYPQSKAAKAYAGTVLSFINAVKKNLDAALVKGVVSEKDNAKFQHVFYYADIYRKNIEKLNKTPDLFKDFSYFVIDPILPFRILPNTSFVGGEVPGVLEYNLVPSEYEAGGLVIKAHKKMENVLLKLSALKGESGEIKESNIDIKIIKCWYKRKADLIRPMASSDMEGILVPELLLNNDKLIKVENKNNFALLKNQYRLLTERKTRKLKPEFKGRFRWEIKDFPIQDSPKLLPTNINPNENKQFQITIHADKSAKPGTYWGNLLIIDNGTEVRKVKVKVNILDFRFAPTKFVSSLFYRGIMRADGKGSISSEWKTPAQYEAEMKDMVAHNVHYPTVYQDFDENIYDKMLKIWKRSGIKYDKVFSVDLRMSGNYVRSPSAMNRVLDEYKKQMSFYKKYGVKSLGVMGLDEGKGDNVKNQLPGWKAVKNAGGFMWTAGDLFEDVDRKGYLDYLIVNMSSCDLESGADKGIDKFSEHGKVLVYSFPQAGVEDPYIYRRNYGLVLWAYGIKGSMNYAYQDSYSGPYNDFAKSGYKIHMFSYPTVDGVIDTLQWEGYREGIDDYYYMETLEKAIADAKKNKVDKQEISAAVKFVNDVRKKMKKYTKQNTFLDDVVNLGKIRKETIAHIKKLRYK